jgi:O-antigen ligase
MHEAYNNWVWVIGIPFSFFLALLLLINAKAGLLFFVLAIPALQPLMRITMTIPGSTATVALGGPLQTMILLAGIWMVMSSKVKLLKMPAVSVFLLLWLIMGISIIEAPGQTMGLMQVGWISRYIPKKLDYVQAIKEWNRIGSFIFIYILAGLTFKGEKDIAGFIKVLLLSMLVPLALGMYQFIFHAGFVPDTPTIEHYNRIMGTYGNPVEFALSLTFPLLLCITMVLDREMRYEHRAFFACCAVVLASFLFVTYTRSAWFGIVAGIIVIGLKRNKSLIVAAPLLVLLVLLLVPLESVRLGEFSTGRLTFSGRIDNWRIMLPMVKDYPFLGRGLTGFTAFTQSDHVRLLLETGFLGWAVFLCLIWTLLKALHRAYRSSQAGIEKDFSLAYLAFFVCTLVIGFSETNAIFQHYVWIPAGIVLSKSIRGSVKRADAAVAPQRFKDSSSLTAPGHNPGIPIKRAD